MATEMMLRYVLELARKNTEALGFIPAPKLEQYAAAGQLWMAYENDDPCGYLVFGAGWPVLRIYQACIQYDARRREHGLALLRRLIAYAIAHGYEAISCWCADDLEANAFWQAAGFVWAGQREGGRRRGSKHNRWVLWLPHPRQGILPLGVSLPESE